MCFPSLSGGNRPFPALVHIRHCSLSSFRMSFTPSGGYFLHMHVLIRALLNPQRRPSANLQDFFSVQRSFLWLRWWWSGIVGMENCKEKKRLGSGQWEEDCSEEWATQSVVLNQCWPVRTEAQKVSLFITLSTETGNFHNNLTEHIEAWISCFIFPHYCILWENKSDRWQLKTKPPRPGPLPQKNWEGNSDLEDLDKEGDGSGCDF